MTTATIVNRQQSWNGTPGMSTKVALIHGRNPDFEKRIAHAVVDFIIDNFGSDEAEQLTLAQMEDCYATL